LTDYIFLIHGGSAIGDGICVRKGEADTRNIKNYIKAYIKVEVDSLGARPRRGCLAIRSTKPVAPSKSANKPEQIEEKNFAQEYTEKHRLQDVL
jgi:hypothetical protein